MFNFGDPFYRPIWRRIVICTVCVVWGIVEFSTGSPGFAILFLALGAYAVYRLFVTFAPNGAESDGTEQNGE